MHQVGSRDLQPSLPVRAILAQSLFVFAVLIYTVTPLCAEDQDRIASLRSSVLALSSARRTASQELENPSLSKREAADYRDFIVYLNTRVANYCLELFEQDGPSALEDLNCPSGTMKLGPGEPPGHPTEGIVFTTSPGEKPQTQAEKTAALDGDFLATLGEFDEMLLKEEARVAARVPSQRESSSSGQSGFSGRGDASGSADETGSGEAGETGEEAGASGDDAAPGVQDRRTGDASGTRSGAGAGDAEVDHSTYGAPGGKLPPPEDDDIVARQLREAAEKEPDPELRKKLWEEYWKYKGVKK